MLVLDAETLAKHLANGSLSKDKFVKLSHSLGKIEREPKPESFFGQCLQLMRCSKELRNYTLKWQLTRAWRILKFFAFSIIVLGIFAFTRIDSDDLEYMMEYGFDTRELVDLIIAGTPETLPEDINQIFDYMLEKKTWERLHVKHIGQQWKTLEDPERKAIKKTDRFRAFSLMLAIKNAEQQKRLTEGDMRVARYLVELRNLDELIS